MPDAALARLPAYKCIKFNGSLIGAPCISLPYQPQLL